MSVYVHCLEVVIVRADLNTTWYSKVSLFKMKRSGSDEEIGNAVISLGDLRRELNLMVNRKASKKTYKFVSSPRSLSTVFAK